MRYVTGGKVKDIYQTEDDSDTLLFRFSDRVSAYDVKFDQDIPRKGEVLCRFAEFWFERLSSVPNHFVRRVSDTEIIVKKMKMLPIECVVRGYLYGSLYDRCVSGRVSLPHGTDTILASRLPKPVFDPTTKSEHDIPITRQAAVSSGLVSAKQYDWLENTSISIYREISSVADSAGFILADLKMEFGVLDTGTESDSNGDTDMLALGDSIGPDEYRMWPKDEYKPGRVQASHDKQILRDWLSEHGYKKQFEDELQAGRVPAPPKIPPDVVSEMTARYVDSFVKITGVKI